MILLPPTPTLIPYEVDEHSSGNVTYDTEYFYVKYRSWKRFPLFPSSTFEYGFPAPIHEGDVYIESDYFYIVINKQWFRSPYFVIKPNRPIGRASSVINIKNMKLTTFPQRVDSYGTWGMMSFDSEYFCIWGQGKWHKIPIFPMK